MRNFYGDRKTSNPNVLFESGYALKTLGERKFILVVNSAYGKIESLPFDLRGRRPIIYNVHENCQDKSLEKKKLKDSFIDAIKIILDEMQKENKKNKQDDLFNELKEAIQNHQPKQISLIDEFMNNLVKELKELSPDFTPYQYQPPEDKEVAKLIVDSLNNSDKLVIKFTEICQEIAIVGNYECVERLYDKFSKIADLFNRSRDYSGISYEFSFDYFRIIGGRLFLILITCLVNEQQWDLISKILAKDLYVENRTHDILPKTLSFIELHNYPSEIWRNLQSNENYLQQLEDFFKKIDTDNLITLEEYKSADLFLYFYSQQWILTTIIQKITDIPRYLIEAEKQEYAINLSSVLGCHNIEELKILLNQKINDLINNQFPLGVELTIFVSNCNKAVAKIGTK